MSISDTTENAILNLIFSATTWANYAINATTSPETNIVISLQTADPGDTGTQSTSEVGYTSYARVNVARSTGWSTASTGTISPVANIDFPAGSGGSGTVSFFTTGKRPGRLAISAARWSRTAHTGNGVTPRLTLSTITLD
jgi:hypothetical protein